MEQIVGDVAYFFIYQTNQTGQDEVANATSTRPKSTPEGMLTAYVSLVVMALIPIVVGAFKSVDHHRSQRQKSKESGQEPETMTSKDAMMFPLIASCALFGLYILFRIFSKEYINLLMTGYFVVLGALAMSHLLAPLLRRLKPRWLLNPHHHLLLTRHEEGQPQQSLVDFTFDRVDMVSFGLSSVLALWYLLKKHWVANNIFGIAFAVNGVELLHLNSVVTGCILLSGLFLYDIFWVFGTDVMVTVAKSFEAPIKLVFPQDFLEKGFFGTNMAMLGLGDIVIPGIFIALLLRFDKSLNRGSNSYFNASFLAYIVGLITTIVVMSFFKHAQPALLYLVPACIIFPLTLALIKGDFKAMLAYEDHPKEEEEEDDEDDKKTN